MKRGDSHNNIYNKSIYICYQVGINSYRGLYANSFDYNYIFCSCYGYLFNCNAADKIIIKQDKERKNMLKIIFNDSTITSADFKKIKDEVIQLTGDNTSNLTGFKAYNANNLLLGDYSAYTTKYNLYTDVENGIQLSTGATEPEPTPTPEPPEPVEPTLEEVKLEKITEMNSMQQEVIQSGVDVQLIDGTTEHFTLTDQDQTSLMALQTQVLAGVESVPWHTSDTTEHCKYYSNADMALIVTAVLNFITFHVTYFRDLRIYINALETKEEVDEIVYGVVIPEDYQSQVLSDLYTAMSTQEEVNNE